MNTARVSDLGYAAGWQCVRQVPEPVARGVFDLAGRGAARRDGPGVRQLRANLRRVLGSTASPAQLDVLVEQAMRSYARYWRETFRLPRMDVAEVAARAESNTQGIEHIDAALAAGRGCILALPHSGNWDVAGIWLVNHTGQAFTTVAERLRPESLFDRFVAYRESLGFEVVPLTGGPRPPTAALSERLRAGGVVCLLAERDLSGSGVEVEFFGDRATMPPGPALLAAQTGAALLPVGLWFTERGWGQRILPPLEVSGVRLRDQVRTTTQALADSLAGLIAEHPADWHMLQRLWHADARRPPAGATP